MDEAARYYLTKPRQILDFISRKVSIFKLVGSSFCGSERMNRAKAKPNENILKKGGRLWFDELSMKEAESRAKAASVVIIPIGSVEEHGDHLPLCTDSVQPEYVAQEVAKKTGCLVAPPLRYGVCNSTRGFPGTISITFDALYGITRDILEEFVRNHFTRILVLSGHAGQAHMAALKLAAQEVVWQHHGENPDKRPRIMVCSDYDFAYELKESTSAKRMATQGQSRLHG
jgi:hypothetical protein